MNIITHLLLGNNEERLYTKDYLVMDVHTFFSRKYNAFHPTSSPECDSIDISLVVPDKNDLRLHEWYVRNQSLSGCLRYELMDLDSKGEHTSMRYLFFSDAQCYYLGERYDIKESNLRIMDMKLKAASCSIGRVRFGREIESDEF